MERQAVRDARAARRGTDGRGTDRRALAAAVFVHVALGAVLLSLEAARPSTPSDFPDEPTFELVTIDGLPERSGRARGDGEPTAPRGGASTEAIAALEDPTLATRQHAAAREANTAGIVSPPERERDPSPPPGPETRTSGAGDDAPAEDAELLLAHPSLGLALGGPNAFAVRGGLTDPSAGAPVGEAPPAGEEGSARPRLKDARASKEAVEASLRAAARQREADVGLGPEGPLVRALLDATYATPTETTGVAVFVARTDGTGNVLSLELEHGTGSRTPWLEAARQGFEALRGKPLRLPKAAKGASMRIEVRSAFKLPSGHDPGVDLDLFGLRVKNGEGPRSTKISILDPIPKLKTTDLEVAPGVKVPIVGVHVDALAIHGDPSDLGAKGRRVVHAKVVESTIF